MDTSYESDQNPYNRVGPGGNELTADIVTLYVIREVFGENSDVEKNMWDFLQNTTKRNRRKYEDLSAKMNKWDLNKKPLKDYITKK